MTENNDKFQEIAEKILVLMDKGELIWRKPWFSSPVRNAVTGNPYRGINPIICHTDMAVNGWEYPLFLSFNQAKVLGWTVKKGSKATNLRWGRMVSFETEDEKTGEKVRQSRPSAKWLAVFNIACCGDYSAPKKIGEVIEKYHQQPLLIPSDRDDKIESFIAAQDAVVTFGGDKACYFSKPDKISMPKFEDFSSKEAYYATFIHELCHWSGHESRLKRDMSAKSGTPKYAREELTAELGAAFCCNELNVTNQIEAHASYLQSWLKILKEDNKAFFRAVGEGQKAANFLLKNAGMLPEKEN